MAYVRFRVVVPNTSRKIQKIRFRTYFLDCVSFCCNTHRLIFIYFQLISWVRKLRHFILTFVSSTCRSTPRNGICYANCSLPLPHSLQKKHASSCNTYHLSLGSAADLAPILYGGPCEAISFVNTRFYGPCPNLSPAPLPFLASSSFC